MKKETMPRQNNNQATEKPVAEKKAFDPVKFLEERRAQENWPTNPESYSGELSSEDEVARHVKFNKKDYIVKEYNGDTGDATLIGKDGNTLLVSQEELYKQNQRDGEQEDIEDIDNDDVEDLGEDLEEGINDQHPADSSPDTVTEIPQSPSEVEAKKLEELKETINFYCQIMLKRLKIPFDKSIDLESEIQQDLSENINSLKSENFSEYSKTVQRVADQQLGKEILEHAKIQIDLKNDDDFLDAMGLTGEEVEFDEIAKLQDAGFEDGTLSPHKLARLGELYRSKAGIKEIDGTLPKKAEKPAGDLDSLENEPPYPQTSEHSRIGSLLEKQFLRDYLAKYKEIEKAREKLKIAELDKKIKASENTESVFKTALQEYEKKLNELMDLFNKVPTDYPYAEDIESVLRRVAELTENKFDNKNGRLVREYGDREVWEF